MDLKLLVKGKPHREEKKKRKIEGVNTIIHIYMGA